MLQENNVLEAFVNGGQNIFFHCAGGVMAVAGMDMRIEMDVDERMAVHF
jgi:hypothetical protein